jgi:DNA-binding transcriptional ArsR family regulator
VHRVHDGVVAELAPHDAAKAVAHPLRVTILELLDGRVASPIELARELDESIGNVSYHARILRRLGAIRLVRTRQRRGATEHFYTGTVRITITQEMIGLRRNTQVRSTNCRSLP